MSGARDNPFEILDSSESDDDIQILSPPLKRKRSSDRIIYLIGRSGEQTHDTVCAQKLRDAGD